jgi:ParB family transcriptional regulator, chromosome partitioning protein
MEIPISQIDSNPFNSRYRYDQASIRRLADSFASGGQLVSARVRPHPTLSGKYQLVYGHRRFAAAKHLGLEKLRVEVAVLSDEQMLQESIIENLERETLSDYEKALSFHRLNKDFGKTYDQIGKLFGLSQQYISNLISMLKLFDPAQLQSDQALQDALFRITQRHARILAHIQDIGTRANFAKMVVNENWSPKDLSNVVSRLRTWCKSDGETRSSLEARGENESDLISRFHNRRDSSEVVEVKSLILKEFRLANEGRDFESFRHIHLFDHGFTLYSCFPQIDKIEKKRAIERQKTWFYNVAPQLTWKIEDLIVRLLGDSAALATLRVRYRKRNHSEDLDQRGTIVFVKVENEWKILHEHWSLLEDDKSPRGFELVDELVRLFD